MEVFLGACPLFRLSKAISAELTEIQRFAMHQKLCIQKKVNCERMFLMNSCTNKVQRQSLENFFQIGEENYLGSIKVIEGFPSRLGFCTLLSVLANRGTSRSRYECSSPSVIALLPSKSAFPSRPFIRK